RSSVSSEERDVYEELLTQSEIQNNINSVNTHVALAQVNDAINRQDEAALLGSLRVPALGLVRVVEGNSSWYLEHFSLYKEQKTEQAGAPVQLDKEDLQQVISTCNDFAEAHKRKLEAVAAVNAAIRQGDSAQTVAELMNPEAQLPVVYESAADLYQTELFNLQNQNPAQQLAHEELTVAVEMLSAVAVLNEVLDSRDPQGVIEQLSGLPMGFSNLDEVNFQRVALCDEENGHHGSKEACPHQNAAPYSTLSFRKASVSEGMNNGQESGDDSAVLWLDEIQGGIYGANRNEEEALKLAVAIAEVNRRVEGGDAQQTLTALQCPDVGLRAVLAECSDAYWKILCEKKHDKTGEGSNGSAWVKHRVKDKYDYYYSLQSSEGTWNEPEGFIQNNTQLTKEEIQSIVGGITAEYNREQLWLEHEGLVVQLQAWTRGHLVRKRHRERLEYLHKQEPTVVKLQASWKGYKQRKTYTNRIKVLQDNEPTIVKESGDDSAVLWLDEIQGGIYGANRNEEEALKLAVAIAEVNRRVEGGDAQQTLTALQCPDVGLRAVLAECSDAYWKILCGKKHDKTGEGSNGSAWVKHRVKDKYDYYYSLQSSEGTWDEPKGFIQNNTQLTKEEIQSIVGGITAEYNREQLWLEHEGLVVQLQAWTRGDLVRKRHRERLEYLHKQEPTVVKLQASWKGYKQRKTYTNRIKVLQDNEPTIVKVNEIVKIQSFLRANKARDDYRTLTGAESPPLNVVRKFVHLLDQSNLDFQEELEVTRLREEVVTKIRSSQQLEKDLNLMDIKIGLLVKNRITLQDVVSHSKKLNKKSKGQVEEMVMGDKQGIKGLSLEKRKKLEAYQHFFYLLQRHPCIGTAPAFIETCRSKVDQIQDIVTGNPTVIKMVVSFNRGARGQNALRQLLAPVVKEIIEDKTLGINTNPVEVYKAWVNQLEMSTGEASKLPYDVTTEQALTHEEVRTKLETSTRSLRAATDKVLNSIISSLDHFPTKKLIVDVIRTQAGENLIEILETPASSQQESEHLKLAEKLAVQNAKTPDKMKHSQSLLDDGQLPLEQKKRKILRNLRTLEQAGLVSAEDKYQVIINDISKDIRNQRRYRQRRKAELVKLQQTLNALNSKTAFYEDQVNYYDTYIKTCLDNLNRKNARRSIKVDKKGDEKGNRKSFKHSSLRYTAARLYEKGVILEIEGLQTSQFKNVMFDISPSEEVGDFEVKAKFMGVEMEKVQLHFQVQYSRRYTLPQ
ncbi:UNVERIFIED_CONTAM: hypothetical protein FKN15_023967, partial [Acipenser sinensis]